MQPKRSILTRCRAADPGRKRSVASRSQTVRAPHLSAGATTDDTHDVPPPGSHAAGPVRFTVRVARRLPGSTARVARTAAGPRISIPAARRRDSARHLSRNSAIQPFHPVPEPDGTREQNVRQQQCTKRNREGRCIHDDDQQGENKTVGETHDDLGVGNGHDAGGIAAGGCASPGALYDSPAPSHRVRGRRGRATAARVLRHQRHPGTAWPSRRRVPTCRATRRR